jgi:hypothetical protein
MITTINEFRNYLKTINEGGGAGIRFTTKLNVTFDITLNKENGVFKHVIENVDFNSSSFGAEGYDDGGSNFKGDLIAWELPTINTEDLLKFEVEDAYELSDKFEQGQVATIEEIYNKERYSIKFGFNLYCDYNILHFGGWSRGELKTGDVVFQNTENNVIDEYEIEITTKGNSTVTTDSNGDFINKITPIGKGGENFTYFFKDVFDYNSSKNTILTFIDELKEGEDYAIEKLKEFYPEFSDVEISDYINNLNRDDYPQDLYDNVTNDEQLNDKYHDWWYQDIVDNYVVESKK